MWLHIKLVINTFLYGNYGKECGKDQKRAERRVNIELLSAEETELYVKVAL